MSQESRRIFAAQAAEQGVGQNISFVERLINESAAAKQIKSGDNEEAKAMHAKALTQLEAAKTAQAKGDAEAAAAALSEAKKAMFTAMRLIGGKVVKDKKRENYQHKRQSLEALLEAQQQVRKEKAEQGADKAMLDAAEEVERHARKELAQAQQQFAAGALDAAMKLVNDAYLSIKLSITQMHNGDRLVRSLHFETKEDEYKYELDRNDTHKMLINTVLKEKHEDPRLGKMMDIPLHKADQLRQQAEEKAGQGDYEGAIKLLEQSTQQVIRAIRLGGIFIPG